MTGLPTIGAFLSAAFCTAWLMRSRKSMLDMPNARSLHSTPTPRSGGLAILAGIVVGVTIHDCAIERGQAVGTALGVLVVVSLLDDVRGTPVFLRLAVHFLSAAIALAVVFDSHMFSTGIDSIASILTWIGALLFLVWMINLYNFMDGMDGFAGGMAVIGFGAFGYLGWLADSPSFMVLSIIVAAAAAGFLLFNFPPARIFMGDTGSSVLGFLVGVFILWAHQFGLFPLWIGVLVFSPFIADATVTLLRRVLSAERVWEAHKTHYYQRLVQLGWGHRKTVLVEYGVMCLAALGAVVATRSSPLVQWLLIGLFAVLYSAAAVIITTIEKRATNRV